MRTFISLNIDAVSKRKINAVKDLISTELLETNPDSVKNLKWEDENKYHITLFFIGETDIEKLNEIETGLKYLKPFKKPSDLNFTVNKINAFPNFRYPRVLILDVFDESCKVNLLSISINKFMREFGFNSDKPFHPHVTLARIRRDRKVNFTSLKKFPIPEINFKVNKFSLMESRLSNTGAEHYLKKDFSL